MAEDAWNSRDPQRVALAYTEDSRWRNRSEFFEGRAAIVAFLARKWSREHEYRLIKDLWAFDGDRIAVRFQYEWHDDAGQWHRSYGNEQWEFDEHGLMRRREASTISRLPRRIAASAGQRPARGRRMSRDWARIRSEVFQRRPGGGRDPYSLDFRFKRDVATSAMSRERLGLWVPASAGTTC